MAIQIQGNGGVIADVDGSTFRALRTTNRPVEYGAFGVYQLAMTSGILPAALAAGTASAGHVFAFRWGDVTRLCTVFSVRVRFQPVTVFTAATLTDLGFDAFVVRGYSASHSAGTAAVLTGNSFKTRTSMGTTLLTDARISTTAALTNGTETFDGNAFSNLLFPRLPEVATVANVPMDWSPDIVNGEAPIVLAQNEGIVIRNRNVWPAAGTGIVSVQVRWAEVSAY